MTESWKPTRLPLPVIAPACDGGPRVGFDEEWEHCMCPACEGLPAMALHPCPYQADVENDGRLWCNCCEGCSTDCSDGI